MKNPFFHLVTQRASIHWSVSILRGENTTKSYIWYKNILSEFTDCAFADNVSVIWPQKKQRQIFLDAAQIWLSASVFFTLPVASSEARLVDLDWPDKKEEMKWELSLLSFFLPFLIPKWMEERRGEREREGGRHFTCHWLSGLMLTEQKEEKKKKNSHGWLEGQKDQQSIPGIL